MRSLHAVCGLAFWCAAVSLAPAEDGGAAFFSVRIQPLLRERCFECHSHEKKIKGG